MKNIIVPILIYFFTPAHHSFAQQQKTKELEELISQFKNPSNQHVLVAAHRGDWRNAPENSLRSTQNSIDMGVDIVETDVRKTKDGVLVLMHDVTLDRTTTGTGKLVDITADSLKKLFLKNGAGMKTMYKVPTLEELMLLVKDKRVLVNLDKSWDYIPETYAVLKKTGTVKQGIFKGNLSITELRAKIGSLLDSITYMPMVWPTNYNIYSPTKTNPEEYVTGYINEYTPLAFEVILGKQEDAGIRNAISILQNKKVSVWLNTLWPELCANHEDDLAIDNPDEHWGWIIKGGANIIQTDRPTKLLYYLRKNGFHK
jgi:glycerophosphoryl diester phosphodiesterase